MKFDLALIGFGVIGVEALHTLILKVKKKQIINVVVIDKDIKNIPGGVAYSKINSKYGFFNNPLRLSHPSFKSWVRNKYNMDKFINFVKKNKNYALQDWLDSNSKNLIKKNVSGEVYFPRLVYSFYLEDRINDILKKLKNLNLRIFFFQGEVKKINFQKEYLQLIPKSNFNSFQIFANKKLLNISYINKKTQLIKSKKIIIGNGLLPPKKIKSFNKQSNSNYIWDFYAEGGTNNLSKKIKRIEKYKKKIIITFIGNKAGLLETMLHLKYLIFEKNFNIHINVISKKSATLNKAIFSHNSKPYVCKIFTKSRINKIKYALEILNNLKKEFKEAKLQKYNKYDVWTKILHDNILKESIKKLSEKEKKKYNLAIFPKIRNLTRFTYPEPIIAKEYLEKYKKIKIFIGKAEKIKKYKKYILVKIDNKKKIKSDIVVNVSGPVNLDDLHEESPLIKSIKANSNKFDKRGFLTDKNFMLTNQIYAPGMIAYNFNPSRQTIIKAITNNSRRVIKAILKEINR
tara:strand:- start:237 stop:1781 length:1545 start_codon:yes stop_codon:yes gene_type:complete